MPSKEMQSKLYGLADSAEAMEFCYAKGWTDGLPVVPAREGSVSAILDAAGLESDEEIIFIEHRQVPVIAEKVAINSVMAGCKPAYCHFFPR